MRCVLLIGVAVLTAPRLGGDLRSETRGASGFALAARRLGETGRALYITAHPDDENNGLLVRLSLGRGARAGLLTLTRGEGGQNEIGPELGPALGLLRTEELMRVHSFDLVEQFFTPAYEFGYSFSVEETFEKWGYEETVNDVVGVLQRFRPDVVFIMSPEGEGGGQHHQASARIALAACKKIEESSDWRVARVFEVPFSREASARAGAIQVQVGDYDPLLGMSHAEYGALARNSHRSQGMNAAPKAGSQFVTLVPRRINVPLPKGASSPFDGIDTTITGLTRFDSDLDPKVVAELRSLDVQARVVQNAVRGGNREGALRHLARGVQRIRDLLGKDGYAVSKVRPYPAQLSHPVGSHLRRELLDWRSCLSRGLGVRIRADLVDGRLTDEFVTRGENVEIDVHVLNTSQVPVKVAWRLESETRGGPLLDPIPLSDHRELKYNEETGERLSCVVEGRPSRVNWQLPRVLKPGFPTDRYEVTTGLINSRSFDPPVKLRFSLVVFEVRLDFYHGTVGRRVFDPFVAKHLYRPLKVVPPVSVLVDPPVSVYSKHSTEPFECRVTVRNYRAGPLEGQLLIDLPKEWKIAAKRIVSFERPGEEVHIKVKLRPSLPRSSGDTKIRFGVRVGDEVYREGFQVVSYHHIEPQLHYRDAELTARAVDVQLPA
ncbi:MAG: PIG-L family deacetylase, partial [Planctomycetota bacterium]